MERLLREEDNFSKPTIVFLNLKGLTSVLPCSSITVASWQFLAMLIPAKNIMTIPLKESQAECRQYDGT